MKVRALGNLSGRPGEHDKGAEFDIKDEAYAKELIDAGLVEVVTVTEKAAAKPKAETAAQA